MKEIPLTQGQVALVSDEDYEELSQYRWCAAWYPDSHTFYALRRERGRGIYMHRFLTGADRGQQVDHIDHNGLNNQRCNLRLCTISQNHGNMRRRSTGESPFKGVYLHKRRRRWVAEIKVRGKKHYLGSFTVEEAAARAYDVAAREHFGAFALTNF